MAELVELEEVFIIRLVVDAAHPLLAVMPGRRGEEKSASLAR